MADQTPDLDAMTDEEIEQLARNNGWLPEEEWDDERAAEEGRRKPARFVTPREYVANLDNNTRMLRERNRSLADEAAKMRGQLTDMNDRLTNMSAVINDLMNQNKQMGQRGYNQARRELQAEYDRLALEMRQAVREGNEEEFDAVSRKLNQVDEEKRALETQAPPADEPKKPNGKDDAPPKKEIPPEVQRTVDAWVADNIWYKNDPELCDVAGAIHGRLLREQPGMPLRENLDTVAAEVKRRYPEKFENPTRRDPPGVLTPSGGGGKPRGKYRNFNDLPQELKDVYDRQQRHFKAKGEDYTKDQFFADQMAEGL